MARWLPLALSLALALLILTPAADGQSAKKAKAAAGPPKATPAESLKVAKGYKAELLYTVPQAQFGSWVNMCVDPKGRLIVSDQHGGLYRITPQPIGTDTSTVPPTIERIPANIGDAQGLLWAFDSLYVMVNSGSRPSGLYRVTASQGDDRLDQVHFLSQVQFSHGKGGEHGPHAVIKHPDGKRLTVVCGNQCRMMPCQSTKVPTFWGEDHLLPRMPDGRGFMSGVLGPGGCIYNVSPDGQQWELFSTGYRNPYDAAYNRRGDLFTYDADMEWDFNTPWYRPTRVCLASSGSEYGWRNGAGKYPAYYPDTLPAILDIGPGSPTGVCFGYDAKFPAKYQDAFYICDWSYGKIYAVHLKPKDSSYSAEMEEFVGGSPLPLTDVVINTADGAMYFVIGGRKTQSALYRITYVGTESVTPANSIPPADPVLKQLEAFHGIQDPKAIEVSWKHLDSSDRFIRFAARVALEHQPVAQWAEKALAETNAGKLIPALLALTRTSAACPQHHRVAVDANLGAAILARLNAIDAAKLKDEQRIDWLRVYHILFNRFGQPAAEGRTATLEKLEPMFPTGNRFVDGELGQVLVYLESAVAAEKLVKALLAAPTQEEQLEYARALRVLRGGWTPALRQQYFEWMQKADGFRGGMSFGGFLSQIRNDAIRTLQPNEVAALQPYLSVATKPGTAPMPKRPLVKEYKFDELLPVVEKGLAHREFERGRKMFAEARCAACHRFAQEGGISGPDLTQAAGRFSAKDLLESIMDPNKEISDQYAASEIELEDGRKFVGRIVNHSNDGMTVNLNMLDPTENVVIKQGMVAAIKPSKQSMMPTGTLDTLKEDEILDLMAYVLSRGDRTHAMFKK